VLVVLTAPTWLLISQLCWFHGQLHREGLTTYAYILREQKRAAEPARPSCCARAAARLCSRAEGVATRSANAPAASTGGAPASARHDDASGEAPTSTYATELQRRGAD
jgi:hypothetical protein